MQSTFHFLPHAIEWVWHGYKAKTPKLKSDETASN